jgi:hypothetical protein
MNTITDEINKIKSDLADLSCNLVYGKTCEELVKEIITNTIEKK